MPGRLCCHVGAVKGRPRAAPCEIKCTPLTSEKRARSAPASVAGELQQGWDLTGWGLLEKQLGCSQQQPRAESSSVSRQAAARAAGMFMLALFSPTLNVPCLWKKKARQRERAQSTYIYYHTISPPLGKSSP